MRSFEGPFRPSTLAGRNRRRDRVAQTWVPACGRYDETALLARQSKHRSRALAGWDTCGSQNSRARQRKIGECQRNAPRPNPKATPLRMKQREKIKTIPQWRPIKACRAIDFIGISLKYVNDFGHPIRSMERLEVSHERS